MKRSWRGVWLALALGCAAMTPGTSAGGTEERRVLVIRLDGPVSPVTDQALGRAIERAESGGYAALVIEIDTPGGLETSMRSMVKRLLAARLPVIAWVAPGGSRAASAGVFVVMGADVAAMAPGTNIGAATPVNLQGGMDSTLGRKATNDAAAFARTVAVQRGRNAVWAERAVREAVAASDAEAVELGVVDFSAATLEELLAQADGRTWRRAGSASRTIELQGHTVHRLEPGFRQRVLALIAEPNVAYILMMLGFYGLIFELQNPGSILPGVVGGICILLAFLALSVLPVNYAGIALILLAVVFFLAETQVASHGLLGAGGVIALLLGSLILFDVPGTGLRLAWPVVAAVTVVTAAFFLTLAGVGLAAQRRKVTTGAEGLVGIRGTVVEALDPTGRIRIGDEWWNARSATPVVAGSVVEITGNQGLELLVRPVQQEAMS